MQYTHVKEAASGRWQRECGAENSGTVAGPRFLRPVQRNVPGFTDCRDFTVLIFLHFRVYQDFAYRRSADGPSKGFWRWQQ